jgi:hypothetical protein
MSAHNRFPSNLTKNFPSFSTNYICCCMPCFQINASKGRLDADLRRAMPDIEDDFTEKELLQFTKSGGEGWNKGNVVDALWTKGKDEWHPAVVKEVLPDGGYAIEWCDGATNDTSKTAEQLRPRYKLGTFKELWIHLDENHDGKIDKGEFMRLAPRALRESFDALVMEERTLGMLTASAGDLPRAKTM